MDADIQEKIEQYFSWFQERRREFEKIRTELAASDKYSKEHKRRLLNEMYLELVDGFKVKKRELFDYIDGEHLRLKKFAFEYTGSAGSNKDTVALNYRDAMMRVPEIKDKSRALADAVERGDTAMELAILKNAYDTKMLRSVLLDGYDGKRKDEINELLEYDKAINANGFKAQVQLQTSAPREPRI